MPTFRIWDKLHVDHISCVIHPKQNQIIRNAINMGVYADILNKIMPDIPP